MIQQIPAYQCVCDNCAEVITFGEDWSFFAERSDLNDWIDNEEYSMKTIDDKHICHKCITHDEEGEEIIDLTRKII